MILQNDFQLYNPYAFPKAILYECWRSCKLEHLSSSLAYSMSADLFLLHCFIRSILYWLWNAFICGETKVLRFLLSTNIYLSIYLSFYPSVNLFCIIRMYISYIYIYIGRCKMFMGYIYYVYLFKWYLKRDIKNVCKLLFWSERCTLVILCPVIRHPFSKFTLQPCK